MGTAAIENKGWRAEVEQAFGRVPDWLAQVPASAAPAFWGLFRDFYLGETVIPNKYKELIGLAVSGVTRCRYCALFHTEAAKLHGATDEELAEASLMGGVTMLGSSFINAQQIDYEAFAQETRDIVAYVKSKAEDENRAAPKVPESSVAHA